jgi:hypothetical protein
MTDYHLAQINIGRIVTDTPDDPRLADFMNALDEINALAESSPGFVWRLQSDSGNATDIHAFDDPRMLVNMSVWESVEALRTYVYQSAHTPFVGRRREWFDAPSGSIIALWWVPAGHLPTLEEAKQRLDHLQRHGPSDHAFTFKQPFPAPTSNSD